MGKIGDYDIRDCLLALATLKEKRHIDNIVLYGGSYGALIAVHLAKYKDMFKAMVLRNPLIDFATMANYADLPDGWVTYDNLKGK